jgi:hypothetical protein
LLTFAWRARVGTDFDALSQSQQVAFRAAVAQFVEDRPSGAGFRNGLRVKGVKGAAGIFEMTWADNGRATFEYRDAIVAGEPHIVWRRVGTHTIFDRP